MKIEDAYNQWSLIYDSNENKTRDLEATAIREVLEHYDFENCLEIGCGTGKNTNFLLSKSKKVTAVDFSKNMIEIAMKKIISENVTFRIGDITGEWFFITENYDLATFSLVLEHIENLDSVFENLANFVKKDGYVYIGELHPFKQYNGTKAKFENEDGLTELKCFTHHISDFAKSAAKFDFEIVTIKEFFDNDDRTTIPRILSLLFRKN